MFVAANPSPLGVGMEVQNTARWSKMLQTTCLLRRAGRVASVSPMTILFLAIGVAAGFLSGVFGIGGGILIVPCLLLFARMSLVTATGTSLGALLLPVGALGAWQYYKNGHVNVTASLLLALGLFAGAYLGARFAESLNPTTAQRGFAAFLILVGARIWYTA